MTAREITNAFIVLSHCKPEYAWSCTPAGTCTGTDRDGNSVVFAYVGRDSMSYKFRLISPPMDEVNVEVTLDV